MHRSVPPAAILLGILGLVPFILLGLGSVGANAARDQAAIILLIGYGAVILAFLGGIHWGFALGADAAPGERARLVLGVAPSLLGWVSLAIALTTGMGATGVGILIAGFIGTALTESRAYYRDLLPVDFSYVLMRWALTVVVVAILTTVVVLRLAGAHLLFGL